MTSSHFAEVGWKQGRSRGAPMFSSCPMSPRVIMMQPALSSSCFIRNSIDDEDSLRNSITADNRNCRRTR